MLISYPTTGRKTLQEGTTRINIKSKQVIFPDGTEEKFYSAKDLVDAKSYLVYVNEQVDVLFSLDGAVVHKGSLFPTVDRANLTFDLIEVITTTSTAQIVLQISDEVDGVPDMTIRPDYLEDVTGIKQGRLEVAVAGIAEPLSATSVPCKGVLVSASTDNTDLIVAGGADVIAALATREGTPLYPGDHDTENVTDLNQVYVDVLIAGDGVTYKYYV